MRDFDRAELSVAQMTAVKAKDAAGNVSPASEPRR
jgi:hypothetical protein